MNRNLFFRIASLLLILPLVFALGACGDAPQNRTWQTEQIQGTAIDTDRTELLQTDTEPEATEETSADAGSDVSTGTEHTAGTVTDTGSSPSKDPHTTDTGTKSTAISTQNPVSSGTVSSQPASSSTISSTKPTEADRTDSASEPKDTPTKPAAYTDISPITPENYYGRSWLSRQTNGQKLVKAYDALAKGVEEQKTEIAFSEKITVDELSLVWNCYHSDYPQHFWLGQSYQYYYDKKEKKVESVVPEYTVTGTDLAAAKGKFDGAVKNLLSGISQSMPQYEIEKTIHDRLILLCEYKEATHAHTAYGALVENLAVCEGFARAFQYLCRQVGIETLFVEGTSINPNGNTQENHAWNVVKIDGQYYHVDVTWDNTDSEKEPIHYAWFNVTTAVIQESHAITQYGYTVPACTATAANYFKTTNRELQSLTVNGVLERTEKRGNQYFFQAYVQNGSNATQWFHDNAGQLANAFGLNGYQYELFLLGKEICLIME